MGQVEDELRIHLSALKASHQNLRAHITLLVDALDAAGCPDNIPVDQWLKSLTEGKAADPHTCKHADPLTFGREEAGATSRRFPLRWCQHCGAIRFDAGVYDGNVWHKPVLGGKAL